MYCGKCGKRVLDDMLFCPFCGAAIVIPDQDELPVPEAPAEVSAPAKAPAAETSAPAKESTPPVGSLFTEEEIRERMGTQEPEEPEEEFVPLSFDFDASEEEAFAEEQAVEEAPEPQAEVSAPQPAPERTTRPVPEKKVHVQKTGAYVPVKDVDPENLFMDAPEEDDYDADEFDPDEFDSESDYDDDAFEYEDREEGGFFHRHIRGVVALILLAVVVLVCAVWAFSPNGQLTLAKLNVAWTAEPYAKLGYEAYNAEDYTLSARYYSRAIALENGNYEYAHSAMVAEYMADNIDAATVMAKKCIELSPDSAEPYTELKKIYTGRELPWDVKELLRQGFERTGDASLNLK